MAPDSDDLEPVRIGQDGFAMLGLSGAVMLLSLGTSLLLALGYVLRVAWRTPPDGPPPGRIIVLGMRLNRDGEPSACYQARLDRALILWRRCQGCQIIILRGLTMPGARSEAAAGAAWLRARGVRANSIETEDRSRHTLENFLLYRKRCATERAEPPLLVTSRFHMARSSLLASGMHIAHRRCAAEKDRLAALLHLPHMLHEALLIHWYMTGRSFARLARNKRIAARIT
jgi:uncharacterized SAM-binding protein YcdF (DUF218 family)